MVFHKTLNEYDRLVLGNYLNMALLWNWKNDILPQSHNFFNSRISLRPCLLKHRTEREWKSLQRFISSSPNIWINITILSRWPDDAPLITILSAARFWLTEFLLSCKKKIFLTTNNTKIFIVSDVVLWAEVYIYI